MTLKETIRTSDEYVKILQQDDAREGYVFEKAIVGENRFTEYWNKGAVNE